MLVDVDHNFIGSTEPFEFKAESPKSKLHLTICCKSKTISIIEKARSIHGLALRAKEKVKENLGDNSDSSDSEDPEIITGLNIKQFATINNKSSLVRWIRADGKEKEVHLSFLEAKDRQRFEECLCVLQEGYDINTLSDRGEQISIFTLTWNMGDSCPPDNFSEALSNLLNLKSEIRHNIYVFATQESSHKVEDMSAREHMGNILGETLGENYISLDYESLWKIKIFIFIRKEDFYKISSIQEGKEVCGIANIVRNKGATAVKFKFNNTSLCFVDSHFAAHQDRVHERNDDYTRILGGLKLGLKHFSIDNQFDHVFWLGDLNYRIDLKRDNVLELIEKEDWKTLLEADQLKNQIKLGKVFANWNEGDIKFSPTYRFIRNTNMYNEELGRIPAWCDRILYKSLPSNEVNIQLLDYNAIHSIQSSDHHPVYATFKLKTLKYNFLHPVTDTVIQITNLKGSSLRVPDSDVGNPNPYIKFYGGFLEYNAKTKRRKFTTSPVWQDKHVPKLFSFVSPKYLKYLHIKFVVLDKDFAGAKENIGQGVIPLLNISNEPTPFTSAVSYKGHEAGVISGEICIANSR